MPGAPGAPGEPEEEEGEPPGSPGIPPEEERLLLELQAASPQASTASSSICGRWGRGQDKGRSPNPLNLSACVVFIRVFMGAFMWVFTRVAIRFIIAFILLPFKHFKGLQAALPVLAAQSASRYQ